MAITSVGYDGQVSETEWARMAPRLSLPYWVADVDSLNATIDKDKTLTVDLAPGPFGGVGIMDTSDATESVVFDNVPSGNRYDLIVARRNWQGKGGVTSFEVIKGGSSKRVPAGFNRNEGALDDQLLWLAHLQAGRTTPVALYDLRGFGLNSRVQVLDSMALEGYKNWPGLQAQLGREEYVLQVDRTWVRTGLIAAKTPAYRMRLTRNKTFKEGVGMASIGSGWTVSGDNTMGIQVQSGGKLKFTKAGQYTITGNVWANVDYANEPGSMKFAMVGLWVRPDFEVHKNAHPRGVNQMFAWTGTVNAGDVVDFQFAHYNKKGRRMSFKFETQIEMIG